MPIHPGIKAKLQERGPQGPRRGTCQCHAYRFVDGGNWYVLVETHNLEVGTLDRGKGTEAGMWVSDEENGSRASPGSGWMFISLVVGCGGGVEAKAFY